MRRSSAQSLQQVTRMLVTRNAGDPKCCVGGGGPRRRAIHHHEIAVFRVSGEHVYVADHRKGNVHVLSFNGAALRAK